MIRASHTSESVSIDLTPIIDMVFLLLIFFLVATTFQQTEREMQIALPYASSAGPISAALREIIVNVDLEGRIVVNGALLTAEELQALITRAIADNPEQKVTVRGDRGTAYGNVVQVLDICKNSGIQEPFLDTVMEE